MNLVVSPITSRIHRVEPARVSAVNCFRDAKHTWNMIQHSRGFMCVRCIGDRSTVSDLVS